MTEKLRPFRPIRPGEILKEVLEARGWTQSDFAAILGRPIQAVNEIISGKKAIVPATAVELSRAIDTSPEFWLNLESAYRLDLLHHAGKNNEQIARRAKVYSLVPVKEIAKKGWIKKSKELDAVEREVCQLLEIDSVDDKPALDIAARKSDPYDALSPGQVAWACRARQIARKKKVKPFELRRFNAQVARLPKISVDDDGVAQVPQALANLGVRLVVVEHLPQTYIDGAAFWLDLQSPVVAMSLRYDRIDYFWFTLMHELAHIKKNGKHTGHLDNNLVGPSAEAREDKPEEEQEADDQACEWLLPQVDVDGFVAETKPYFSKAAIVAFAERMGVHPGIVVGRLQHCGAIPYSHSRSMLVKVRERLSEVIGEVVHRRAARCRPAQDGSNSSVRSIEMSKGRDRSVSRRSDGQWANKRSDADKASSLHDTQKEAEVAAREMLHNQGGGELTTMGRDGKIRSKDTIPPGHDSNPPKDTEH